MKPQLRGRIRRNVQTLLEMGADVLVVTVHGGKEFHVGLHHPRLRVQMVEPVSALNRLNRWVTFFNDRRLLMRLQVLGLEPGETYATTWRDVLRGVADAFADDEPDPDLPWRTRARRRVRAGRLAGVRTRRQALRAAVNMYRSARRRLILAARDVLRPWHRLSRWLDFWAKSCDVVVAWQPDIIVSSDLPGLVGAGRAARLRRVPHLHDCHELYLESTHLRRSEQRMLWPVEQHFMRRADAVTCVNRSIADEYHDRYRVDLVVVRNCSPRPASPSIRDVRAMAGLPASARVVLYQGGFAPGRGLEVLVEASAGLDEHVHLVLMGDGRYREELEAMVARKGLGHVVRFVDAVAPADLLSVTASASLGVVPYQPVSLNNRLALPNKVFEYTAAGLPVLVSDVPELRRIAVEGGCGDVYDPYDPDSFAAKVRHLLSPDGYGELCRLARQFGEENCWENERRHLVGALRGISDLWPADVTWDGATGAVPGQGTAGLSTQLSSPAGG